MSYLYSKLPETGVSPHIGTEGVGSTPEELARHLKAETELWGPVIKAANIRSE